MKEKYVRANNAPFMSKVLSKAMMNRSRLRNRYDQTELQEAEELCGKPYEKGEEDLL